MKIISNNILREPDTRESKSVVKYPAFKINIFGDPAFADHKRHQLLSNYTGVINRYTINFILAQM